MNCKAIDMRPYKLRNGYIALPGLENIPADADLSYRDEVCKLVFSSL